jgi:glycosyltransferase involved in cell wall biosynthesis
VLSELHKTVKFIIDMIGINYDGSFNRQEFDEKYPYLNALVPAKRPNSGDMYGREYALSVLAGGSKELQPPYDILFTIQDHFIIEARSRDTGLGFAESLRQMQRNTLLSKFRGNNFVWVGYYPVDGMLKQNWVDNAIAKTNFPVAYCEFGRKEMLKHDSDQNKLKGRVEVIQHGTNTKDFYPVSNEKKYELKRHHFRAMYSEGVMNDDTFLIINVNRNQIRKDLMRTLMVYKEFKKQVPNSFLYLHCNAYHDQGGNLFDIARNLGLTQKDFAVPKTFNPSVGVPIETVNELYNAADAVLTTTLGEGWGLSITEAMATKTPIFAPNITSVPDILNTHGGFDPKTARGFAFKSGSTPTEFVCFGQMDNEVIRPVSNVEDAVEKLMWFYKNRNKKVAKDIVERAYKWATETTWERENEKWVEIFERAIEVNDRMRAGEFIEGVLSKEDKKAFTVANKTEVGRNDPCPLCLANGVTKKVKKCEEHRHIFID